MKGMMAVAFMTPSTMCVTMVLLATGCSTRCSALGPPALGVQEGPPVTEDCAGTSPLQHRAVEEQLPLLLIATGAQLPQKRFSTNQQKSQSVI